MEKVTHEHRLTEDDLPCSVCLTLWDPMDCSPPGSSVQGESPGKNTGVGYHAFLQGNLADPGMEPASPVLQVDSLPVSSWGSPTGSEGVI